MMNKISFRIINDTKAVRSQVSYNLRKLGKISLVVFIKEPFDRTAVKAVFNGKNGLIHKDRWDKAQDHNRTWGTFAPTPRKSD